MKNRKRRAGFAAALVSLFLITFAGNPATKAAGCTNISTVWTLSSTYTDGTTSAPSRITSDMFYAGGSPVPYVDGSGVWATIKSCSTNDAVLIMQTRQLIFNFLGAYVGGPQPPAWTSNSSLNPFASTPPRAHCGGSPCTVLNIGNILGSGDRNSIYMLNTRLESGFVAPDGNWYHLDMDPSLGFGDTSVFVTHYPATSTTKESWVAYPETTFNVSNQPEWVGSLRSGDRSINYGQFSMPFYVTISVK